MKILIIFLLCFLITNTFSQSTFNGPLKKNSTNLRYFTDNSGKAIYLTGSHTWENLQDIVSASETAFDYPAYLDMMQKYNHNFIRMWAWEQARMASWSSEIINFSPLPFARPGPGLATDGKPKFDLTKYNPEYFDRLHQRVIEAGKEESMFQLCYFKDGARTGSILK